MCFEDSALALRGILCRSSQYKNCGTRCTAVRVAGYGCKEILYLILEIVQINNLFRGFILNMNIYCIDHSFSATCLL